MPSSLFMEINKTKVQTLVDGSTVFPLPLTLSPCRYDSGTFGDIWPLGHVTLSLHGPFLTNPALVAAVLNDVSYPDTRLTLSDLHLPHYVSVQPLKDAINMIRSENKLPFCR